jgi:hypothetical protein
VEGKEWRVIQKISMRQYALHAAGRMKRGFDFVFSAEIHFREKEDSRSEIDTFSLEQSVLSQQGQFRIS